MFAIFFMHILLWHSSEESEMKRLVLPDEFDVYQEFQALKKNVTLLQLENRDLRKQLSAGKGLYDMSLVERKPVFGVSDQVRHKPGCTAIEDG